MRSLLGTLVVATALVLSAQQSGDKPPAAQGQKPAPPPPPTVTRSSTGIVVIKGTSSSPAPKKDAAEEEAKAEDTAKSSAAAAGKSGGNPAKPGGKAEAAKSAGGAAGVKPTAGAAGAKSTAGAAAAKSTGGQPVEPAATPETAKVPQSRSVQRQSRDFNGNPIPAQTRETTEKTKSGSQSAVLLRNLQGREVPYLKESEQVLSEDANGKVTERRTHRYNTDGTPISQQLVREEAKKLPDGTVQKTTTVYESDVNGRMQAVERKTEHAQKIGDTTRTVSTSERPTANGGFRAYAREESLETRKGETSATMETVRKVADDSGRLVEDEREQSVMTKSGNVATTETKVWKQSAATAGKIELQSRKVGKLTEKPDGSKSEVVETYGTSRASGPTDVNSSSARIQERVVRETRVTASGETVQTTTTESRGVADATQLGSKRVVRQVGKPTADGETVETQVYEQGVNGQMKPTESYVEQVKK